MKVQWTVFVVKLKKKEEMDELVKIFDRFNSLKLNLFLALKEAIKPICAFVSRTVR